LKTMNFFYDGRNDAWVTAGDLSGATTTVYEPDGSSRSNDSAFSYDEYGSVISATDAEGATSTVTYKAPDYAFEASRTVTITKGKPVGAATVLTSRFWYDARGNLVDNITPNGRWLHFAYDAYGRVTEVSGSLPDRPRRDRLPGSDTDRFVLQTISYNDISSTGSPISVVNRSYYGTGPADYLERKTFYDGLGRVLQGKRRWGSRWSTVIFRYNAIGQVLQETLPFVTQEDTFTLLDFSRAADHGVAIKIAAYDSKYRPTYSAVQTSIAGLPRAYEISARHGTWDLEVQVFDPAIRRKLRAVYDAHGRLEMVEEKDGDTVMASSNYTYNLLDHMTSYSGPNGNTTTISNNSIGLLRTVIDPDRSNCAVPQNCSLVYEYDRLGRLIQSSDAKRQTVTASLDELGRTYAVTFADSQCPSGKAAGACSYVDDDASYSYDDPLSGLGLLSRAVKGTSTSKYFYDSWDRLVRDDAIVNGLQYSTRFEYDFLGRLIRIEYPRGDGSAASSFGSCRSGLNAGVGVGSCVGSCGGFSSDCSCDDSCVERNDCCRDKREACGGTSQYSPSCGGISQDGCSCLPNCDSDVLYPCCSDVAEVCDLFVDAVEYKYTSFGPVESVRWITDDSTAAPSQTVVEQISYDVMFRPTRIIWNANSGLVTDYVYNTTTPFGYQLLELLRTRDRNGRAIRAIRYGYDASGNRALVEDLTTTTKKAYHYDYANRLVREDVTTAQAIVSTGYEYDAAGNLQRKYNFSNPAAPEEVYTYGVVPPGSGTFAGPHAVGRIEYKDSAVTYWSRDYTYDENGNMMFASTSAGSNTYKYNFDGRMTYASVDGAGAAGTWGSTELHYNAMGYRDFRKDVADDGLGGKQITTRHYFGDIFEVFTDPAGYRWNERYILLDGRRIAYISDRYQGEVHILHADVQGSVRTATEGDAAQGPSLTRSYDVYGTQDAESGVLTNLAYGYAGEEHDITGLLQLGVRHYDPTVRRMMQPDNIVPNIYDPQSLNPYSYAYNNPVLFTDPTGYQGEPTSPDSDTTDGSYNYGIDTNGDGVPENSYMGFADGAHITADAGVGGAQPSGGGSASTGGTYGGAPGQVTGSGSGGGPPSSNKGTWSPGTPPPGIKYAENMSVIDDNYLADPFTGLPIPRPGSAADRPEPAAYRQGSKNDFDYGRPEKDSRGYRMQDYVRPQPDTLSKYEQDVILKTWKQINSNWISALLVCSSDGSIEDQAIRAAAGVSITGLGAIGAAAATGLSPYGGTSSPGGWKQLGDRTMASTAASVAIKSNAGRGVVDSSNVSAETIRAVERYDRAELRDSRSIRE
jgi:RHS repeat-associated protein